MGKGVPDEFDVTLKGEGTHDIDLAIDLMGLEDIDPTITLQGGEPIKTESAATLNVPEAIRTETKLEGGEPIRTDLSLDIKPLEASVDVKPLTADLCVNVGVSAFPPTRVCAPFSTHFGFTLFGVEVLGFNLAGENRLQIEPLRTPPQVAWGGTEAVRPVPGPGRKPARGPSSGGGLRIRLDR